ncbi:MAG: TRAP transporter large permease subunit [Pseudomonadota bacterium]
MEWQLVLGLILLSLIAVMATGMPVAICFFTVNLVLTWLLWGGMAGLQQFILSLFSSLTTFALLPLPMFILMGEMMFHSGIGPLMLDALDKWLGRLPGRLSILAVGTGILFSSLTGASMTSIALLGTVLLPQMEKRGYKTPMTLGPIMGSGGLAILIPPSGLAVLLGAIGQISVGKLLMAIIVPGLLLAFIYGAYIIVRCWLQPHIAPPYEVAASSMSEKIAATVKYILPLGFVIFMVIGLIILGVASPTEAAATGALSLMILTAAYRRLNWSVMKKSLAGTVRITGMIFLILSGAKAFSQVLSFSGATQGLIEAILAMPLSPMFVIIIMMAITFVLGMFMDVVSLMMVSLPLFVPVVRALNFDPVWFGVLFLINVELAVISPPFGLSLFAMKGVAPEGTKMMDIYGAALAFIVLDVIAIALVMLFPQVALWLPGRLQ